MRTVLLTVIALTSAATVAASTATGLVVRDSTYSTTNFGGSGCGSTSTKVMHLPRHATAINNVRPLLGTKLTDQLTGQTDATITAVSRQRLNGAPAIAFVATGSDDVCTNPGTYGGLGWTTVDVDLSARFRHDTRVYIPGSCTDENYRPRKLIVACGDGNLFLTGLRWSSWNGRIAHGRGTAHLNNCSPNCAEGSFSTVAAKVRLSRPGNCGGIYQYRKLMLTLASNPTGAPRVQSAPFPCND